jgi:hypothetical protein
MIYQSEGDNHAIINYVVHGLGLMFGAHTNTGTIVILSWYHFHSWPILILCIIVASTLSWHVGLGHC